MLAAERPNPLRRPPHCWAIWSCSRRSLPKSPAGAAVRYTLNQWEILTRFLDDVELEIDNGATERANRDIALGPATGPSSAATGAARRRRYCFIASCTRRGVERSPGS